MTVARILIADDNPTMREIISFIIEGDDDLTVCGEAHNIATALEACHRLQPDLALIDISMKGDDGLELVAMLGDREPTIYTVVFSLHDEAFYIDRAREAGAHGYVIKSENPDQMLDGLRQVLAGHLRFPEPGAA